MSNNFHKHLNLLQVLFFLIHANLFVTYPLCIIYRKENFLEMDFFFVLLFIIWENNLLSIFYFLDYFIKEIQLVDLYHHFYLLYLQFYLQFYRKYFIIILFSLHFFYFLLLNFYFQLLDFFFNFDVNIL